MRLLASLPHHMAATDDDGLRIHRYAEGRSEALLDGRPVAVEVSTGHPWQGRLALIVSRSPTGRHWTLSWRLPQWSSCFTITVDGVPVAQDVSEGWLCLRREWREGAQVVLDLDLEPRLTRAAPQVDAVRGAVAVERGPLVYCLEQTDLGGGGLDDIVLDTEVPLRAVLRDDLLGGVTAVVAPGSRHTPAGTAGWWPYATGRPRSSAARPELTAIPYYAWANREEGSMPVWIPAAH
ncbi:hypothetical protein [Streptomyces sp. LN549]|uniref:hypothetical protein n=1 Tax=Streptomyces sp. LN549 TaxID=3112979 RepID=UPI0037232CAE